MSADNPVIVRPFRTGDGPDFRRLNIAWIEHYFTVEPSDLAQLDHPEDTILARGGAILLAEKDARVVGTVGLVAHPFRPGTLELIKMAVDSALQGCGIGRRLMTAAIEEARLRKAGAIWLESNRRLVAAIALYRQSGFAELSGAACDPTPYARCDIQMLLQL